MGLTKRGEKEYVLFYEKKRYLRLQSYSVFCLSAIVSKLFIRKCGLCQSNKVAVVNLEF